MKQFREYQKVIAIQERSAGNETVGDMWLDTASFNKSTPISEIVEWAGECSGKLIITIDQSTAKKDEF